MRHLVPLLALGLLAVLGTAALTRQIVYGCWKPGGSVPAPAPSAHADEVVRVYLAALAAHDLRTVRSLTTPRYFSVTKNVTDSPFCGPKIYDVHIRRPVPERPEQAPEAEGAYVMTSYKLSRTARETTIWAYLLIRTDAHKPWRIYDSGNG